MKLSDGEKLTLFMLTEIYEHLGVDGEVNPGFVRNAITDGHAWAIKEKYHGIFWEAGSQEQAHEVGRILLMWRAIEEAYADLSPADKERLAADVPLYGKDPKFDGFDGNASDGWYGTTQFVVNKADFGWDHFKGRSLNSHGAAHIDDHRRMLAVWDDQTSRGLGGRLGYDDLGRVLSARSRKGSV